MTSFFRVIGLCGSLRANSFNGMVLKLAAASMPPSMTLEMVDWSAIPPFNSDVLTAGMPAEVLDLREKIRAADAVLIATPEYNFSIPGMFKNTLDWISRGDDQPLRRKPVAILSASPGPVGGARVQYDLRKVLLFMDVMVLAKPEIFIGGVASKFLPDGKCTDETTRSLIATQMAAFARWIHQVNSMNADSAI